MWRLRSCVWHRDSMILQADCLAAIEDTENKACLSHVWSTSINDNALPRLSLTRWRHRKPYFSTRYLIWMTRRSMSFLALSGGLSSFFFLQTNSTPVTNECSSSTYQIYYTIYADNQKKNSAACICWCWDATKSSKLLKSEHFKFSMTLNQGHKIFNEFKPCNLQLDLVLIKVLHVLTSAWYGRLPRRIGSVSIIREPLLHVYVYLRQATLDSTQTINILVLYQKQTTDYHRVCSNKWSSVQRNTYNKI